MHLNTAQGLSGPAEEHGGRWLQTPCHANMEEMLLVCSTLSCCVDCCDTFTLGIVYDDSFIQTGEKSNLFLISFGFTYE